MTSSERPTARSRPRPADDEGIDPIVATPPAAPAHNEAPGRRGPEPTVQLNVRVASDVHALIDQAQAATGRTKRQLIEQAIRNTYN